MDVELINPAILQIEGGPPLKEWRDSLAVPFPDAQYTRKYKTTSWDGMYRPGTFQYLNNSRWRLKVGRGLLHRFRKDFPDQEITVDHENPDPDWRSYAENYPVEKFRDYQMESLEKMFAARWGRVALATNAGKGAVMAVASAVASDAGHPVLVLADQVSVFEALEEEFRKWADIQPALVESGRDAPPTRAGVTLAMVQTLTRRLGKEDKYKRHDRWQQWKKWLKSINMVLLDEADRATADTWVDIIKCLPNTYWRAGFSGSFDTGDSMDEMQQTELMGPILTQIKNEELVERGVSAKPTVHLHKYTQIPLHHRLPADWFQRSGPSRRRWAYQEGVVKNQHRHEFIEEILDEEGQNAIIVNLIEHGERLERFLPDARFMQGEHSKEQRDEILQAYERGEFGTLIATKLVNRGTNRLAPAKNIVFASGEGSKTAQLQRCGRGLRKWEDKDQVHFHDIMDSPPGHNATGLDNPYRYFETAVRKRVDLYRSENFDIEIH